MYAFRFCGSAAAAATGAPSRGHDQAFTAASVRPAQRRRPLRSRPHVGWSVQPKTEFNTGRTYDQHSGKQRCAYLIPHDQTTAQHEREHQRRAGALERIADHVVRVDSQQHQQQQRHIGSVLDFVYNTPQFNRLRNVET